jgi:predicted helicase
MLIQSYRSQLHDLRKASGSARETIVREAFKDLLKDWGRSLHLIFVPEFEHRTAAGDRRLVDGALLHELRIPFGYWEAKDEQDDLDREIALKFRRGYPQDNIIFEDGRTAVLFQQRQEILRCAMDDDRALEALLRRFFAHERPEISDFRKAVGQFRADLPAVLTALRESIEQAQADNKQFRDAAIAFLDHARGTINPAVTAADVREMLIQHILTEDIFARVFNDDQFHRQNNVAKALYALEGTFFVGRVKKQTLRALEPYYAAIRAAAAQIGSHHDKQTFLKVIYENFYKVYNRKAADRLGVIYTPNEIVRFMVESADWLCDKHFGKHLIDRGVEILDPAAGTGTFIVELIEHFRGQPAKLRAKYRDELHANEVAILPYYVANLNIEATYTAITGEYEEFPNLCFVDTLDNIGWVPAQGAKGAMGDLFGAVSAENVARIRRQNARKISVVIGNPPYNANQQNENDNNKNRTYPAVDRRIRETYVAASHAQKTKLYDMYVRFFRWASDRIGDEGIVAFVSNSSFINKPVFDGFREHVAKDFSEVWICDLKGDARSSGEERRRQADNIFGNEIKVGVAIYFCVRNKRRASFKLMYSAVPDYLKVEGKRDALRLPLAEIEWQQLSPDARHAWLEDGPTDFESYLPLAGKSTRASQNGAQDRAIFRQFALGVSTNRDEWLYDVSRSVLRRKIRYLTSKYSAVGRDVTEFPTAVKWSETLKRRKLAGDREAFRLKLIETAEYRPFTRRSLYRSDLFIDRPGAAKTFFPPGASNQAICFSDVGSRTNYCVLAVARLADLHFGAAVDAYQQVARYRYVNDARIDNITDWALDQFSAHYGAATGTPPRPISKDAIFHYVYGALYDPLYRETYAENLKRSFPRIPFHPDFWRWAAWGEALLALHTGYETVEPWPLRRIDVPDANVRQSGQTPKVLLKSDPVAHVILVDQETQLAEVPDACWSYRLGNRCAIDWVLDQHKERTPKDPTIRELFNTYRFADHKAQVIDQLGRVARVSVETVRVTEAMRALPRS